MDNNFMRRQNVDRLRGMVGGEKVPSGLSRKPDLDRLKSTMMNSHPEPNINDEVNNVEPDFGEMDIDSENDLDNSDEDEM